MRRIGADDVGLVAMGAMPLSLDGRPGEQEAVGVIRTALEHGVRMIDTADAYCLSAADTGHNERLVARALRGTGLARGALVATKGGHYRDSAGAWLVDGRPEYLKAACDASLRALEVDRIWLYQLHRPDPAVPFAESVGALRDLRDAGKVRYVGVSNVSVEQIDVARGVLGDGGVASVQNRLAADTTDALPVLEHCRRHGIAFLAWGVLGGRRHAKTLGLRHPAVARVAAELGVSPQAVTIAWRVAGPYGVVPVIGCGSAASARELPAAARLALGDEHLRLLDEAFPAGVNCGRGSSPTP